MPEIERKDYESPSSVWMFSEIAVDMVFENNEFFKSIAIKTGDKPAYNHFYNDKIGNVTIIDYFRKLFEKCKTMDEFIVKGTKESLKIFKSKQ